MPVYSFKCKTCQKEFDAIVKFDTKKVECPICKDYAEKMLSMEKIRPVFKGTGWTAPSGKFG